MQHNHNEDDDQGMAGGADIDEVLCDIGERLESIEKKLDMLLGQSQPNSSPQRRDFSPRGRDHYEPGKSMTKVVCAKCGDTCEVPFRPSGDRPVYCRNCFNKGNDRGSRGGFGNKRGGHSGFKRRPR